MNNPFLLAGSTIVLWSFGSYFARLISISSEFLLLSFSFIFTFFTLLIYTVIDYRQTFIKQLRTIKWMDILVGPFGYFVYSAALNLSYRNFDSASETTVLNYTWPVFTVIFTHLVFKGVTRKDPQVRLIEWLGIGLGFLSVVVLATQGEINHLVMPNLPGIGWGLLAGASYGFFSAYSGTVSRERQSIFLLTSITISMVLMGLISIPEIGRIKFIDRQDILVVVALGCVLNGIGYITWTRANRVARENGINISSIASMMFILPILSLLIIALLLEETILTQTYFLFSLLLVFLSTIFCQRAVAIAQALSNQLARVR